jgi:predicted ATPase
MTDHGRGIRGDSPRRTWSPLVGRADEVRHLTRCWERARGGHGNAVVIAGEAGIGKSRLSREVELLARRDDATLLRFQCSPIQSNSNLHPIYDHLVQFAGIRLADAEDLRLQKLQRMLAATSPAEPPGRLLSSLVAITGPSGVASAHANPQRQRLELFEVMLEGTTALAAVKPVLAIIEDVQWLDPTSNEFLAHLVQHVALQRLLLVVTARREFDPSWIGQQHTSVIVPRRLNRADTLALAQRIAGQNGRPVDALEPIWERSEGVPLFVEELSKDAVAHRGATPQALQTPASLQALVLARLDQVGPAKRLAQLAAVLGGRFGHEIAALVWGGT